MPKTRFVREMRQREEVDYALSLMPDTRLRLPAPPQFVADFGAIFDGLSARDVEAAAEALEDAFARRRGGAAAVDMELFPAGSPVPEPMPVPTPTHAPSASPAARPEAVAVPAAPETPDSASAPTVAPPEAAPDGKPEAAEARQDRRLLELRSMGADFVPHGDGWRVIGKRGALAALVKREAGRPMCTKDGIRKDLQRAVQREMGRNGRRIPMNGRR